MKCVKRLWLLGLLGMLFVFPVSGNEGEQLPVYQLPEGISVSWVSDSELTEHLLFLPDFSGITYEIDKDKIIKQDSSGSYIAFKYGEQVEIPIKISEELKNSFENVYLEGAHCCLLSDVKGKISFQMPDEDVKAVPMMQKDESDERFTPVEDLQGDKIIHVTGKEPGNPYVNAYDSAGNKLATMKFWVENRQSGEKMFAFCLEPQDYTPKSGEWYTSIQGMEQNGSVKGSLEEMRKILYYGYGGDGNIFTDEAVGLVTTHLALGHLYTGKRVGFRLYEPFLKQLESLEMPYGKATLTKPHLVGKLNGKGELETEVTTLQAFGRNCFYFSLPADVTIHLTTGQQQTGGRCMVSGGQSFYFTAPAGKAESFSTGKVKGTYKEPIMYLVNPKYATRQTLMGVEWLEKSEEISLDVEWENPLSNVTVTKKIKAADIVWEHGNPTFFFTLEGKDLSGKHILRSGYVEYTKEQIQAITGKDGMASLSYVFESVPRGKNYQVYEEQVQDYVFQSITGSAGVVIQGKRANINLVDYAQGTEVIFTNKKSRWDGFKHNNLKVNIIRWN